MEFLRDGTYNCENLALVVGEVISPQGEERPKNDIVNKKRLTFESQHLGRVPEKCRQAFLKGTVCGSVEEDPGGLVGFCVVLLVDCCLANCPGVKPFLDGFVKGVFDHIGNFYNCVNCAGSEIQCDQPTNGMAIGLEHRCTAKGLFDSNSLSAEGKSKFEDFGRGPGNIDDLLEDLAIHIQWLPGIFLTD